MRGEQFDRYSRQRQQLHAQLYRYSIIDHRSCLQILYCNNKCTKYKFEYEYARLVLSPDDPLSQSYIHMLQWVGSWNTPFPSKSLVYQGSQGLIQSGRSSAQELFFVAGCSSTFCTVQYCKFSLFLLYSICTTSTPYQAPVGNLVNLEHY